MQRLFSTFPNGWPGRGLILQRVIVAGFLFWSGFVHRTVASSFASVFPHLIEGGAGIFLLLGLWTPACGTLITLIEAWIAFRCGGGISIMLATLGATLAMIGPGAWSVDARLFGRKHYRIKRR